MHEVDVQVSAKVLIVLEECIPYFRDLFHFPFVLYILELGVGLEIPKDQSACVYM